MPSHFYPTTIPFGRGVCPATVTPQIWRITSADAARALRIPLKGHWHRKLAQMMRELGWEPVAYRHNRQHVRGYQRTFENNNPRS